MVFNTLQIVKVKWYQRGAFKFLLTAVAVALVVYGIGSAIYGAVQSAISAAAIAGAAISSGAIAIAVITTLTQKLVIGLVLSTALKVAVRMVGHKLGGILAIIAIVAAAYGQIQGSTWAGDVMKVGVGLAKASEKELVSKMSDLQGDIQDFQETMKEQKEELEKGQDLLNSNHVHLVPLHIWGETPDQFYYRTNQLNAPGRLAIEMSLNYVATSLRLPTIQDSLYQIETLQNRS